MQNQDTRPNTNGNGHFNGNGNGHGIFTLAAKPDPDTIAVLETRRAARSDTRLTRSMKACFDEVADRALNPAFYDAKGIVAISDTVLAEIFSVSNRTVYTWKYKLQECGYVWLNHKFKTNMWPLTTYHLSALHKAPRLQKTDADGTYGAGKFRPAPLNPGLGARKPGQPSLPLPGSRTLAEDTKSEEMQGISGENRFSLRVSPEANFGSEPKPASGESRNPLPVRPEADCRHKKAKALRSGTGEGSFKRSTGLNARNGLPGRGEKTTKAENFFLLEVGAMMEQWRKGSSKAELSGSGAWWRLTYRTAPDLMTRVLAEVLMLVKESRIKTSPGQAAVDLAQRWGLSFRAGDVKKFAAAVS